MTTIKVNQHSIVDACISRIFEIEKLRKDSIETNTTGIFNYLKSASDYHGANKSNITIDHARKCATEQAEELEQERYQLCKAILHADNNCHQIGELSLTDYMLIFGAINNL